MENNRTLTSEELLDFISKISKARTVSDIENALQELNDLEVKEEEIIENKIDDKINISNTNSINGASIYDVEDLPLVRADLEAQKEVMKIFEKEISEDINVKDEEKIIEEAPKTLERKKTNPWEGLRTATPGENN